MMVIIVEYKEDYCPVCETITDHEFYEQDDLNGLLELVMDEETGEYKKVLATEHIVCLECGNSW